MNKKLLIKFLFILLLSLLTFAEDPPSSTNLPPELTEESTAESQEDKAKEEVDKAEEITEESEEVAAERAESKEKEGTEAEEKSEDALFEDDITDIEIEDSESKRQEEIKEAASSIYFYFNTLLYYALKESEEEEEESKEIERSEEEKSEEEAVNIKDLSTNILTLFSSPYWHSSCDLTTLFDYYSKTYKGSLYTNYSYDPFLENAENLTEKIEGKEGKEEAQTTKDELQTIIEGNARAIKESNELQEGTTTDAIVEKSLRNVKREIVLHSYDKELFSIKMQDGKKTVITGYDNLIERNFFDDQLRLAKKEVWDMSGGLESANKTKTQNWEYQKLSSTGSVFTAIPIASDITTDDAKFFYKYNDSGYITEEKIYTKKTLPPDKDKEEGKEKEEKKEEKKEKTAFVLTTRTKYTYTPENKISEKLVSEYEYNEASPTKIIARHDKKECYEYKVDKGNPDYYYYENGRLCVKILYSEKTSYITTSYFEEGFTVESHYIKGDHIKDLYYLNGKVLKEKVFNVQKTAKKEEVKKE